MSHRSLGTDTPHIRPLTAGDERTVEAVFGLLTPEQRSQRFHVAMPRLTPGMTRHLADVDGHDRVALVVELGGRPVGIGRYTRVGPACAELAVAVAAEHTGRGLGSSLVDALARHAVRAGIEELVFEVTGTNAVAQHMARSRGAVLVRTSGAAHGSLHLSPLPRATQAA